MPSQEHDELVSMLLTAPAAPGATLDESRAGFDGLIGRVGVHKEAELTQVAGGAAPAVRLDSHSPAGANLLWVHGGGLVSGSASAYAAPLSRLFPAVRTTIVDFRLAPEHPLPAALHDVVSAYRDLLADGVPAERIVLGGDSAGGGLALMAHQELVTEGLPQPAGLLLVSPWADWELSEPLREPLHDPDPLLTREALAGLATTFGGDAATLTSLSPLRRPVEGIRAVHIEYGSRDTAAQDSDMLVELFRGGDVPVEAVRGDDLIHVYPILLPDSPEGVAAADRMNAFITSQTRSAR